MYERTTASIKGMKTSFEIIAGCRQGGQESPEVFNFYFDLVLKVAAAEIDKIFPNGWGIEFSFLIPNNFSNRDQRSRQKLQGIEVIHWILYTDDVVFANHYQDADKLLNIIHTKCKRFTQNISFKKTKTQAFNDKSLAEKPTLITVDGHVIENVRQFTYLGHIFDDHSAMSCIEYDTGLLERQQNLTNCVRCYAV